MRRIQTLSLLVIPLAFLSSEASGSQQTLWGGRQFEQIPISGATCGSGTPYHYFFSAAPVPTERRLAVYFGGGGETSCSNDANPCSSADITSSIAGLDELRTSLTAPDSIENAENIFGDRRENDSFIGSAHWLVIPYCTADQHTGRRLEEQSYDMTYVANYETDNSLVGDVEKLLNEGFSVVEIVEEYPGLELSAGIDEEGDWEVHRLLLNIEHRGDANISAVLEDVRKRLQEISPNFFHWARILVTGDSAGGMGAWYQFWRFGDLLTAEGDGQLTLAPMTGNPLENWIAEKTEELELNQTLVEALDQRWESWHGKRPCEIEGAEHVPSKSDNCDDILALIDHYQLERYADRDIQFLTMIDMDDYRDLGRWTRGADTLREMCATTFRYLSAASDRPAVFPYLPWLFDDDSEGGPDDEDVSDLGAAMAGREDLESLLRPNGGSLAGVYSQLEYLNALADRGLADASPMVDLMLEVLRTETQGKIEIGGRNAVCFGIESVPALGPAGIVLLFLSLAGASLRILGQSG